LREEIDRSSMFEEIVGAVSYTHLDVYKRQSEGGGRILEDDKTISVNNPIVIRAWRRATRWVGSISPPGVTAYGLWDAQNVWGSGEAAFLRGWQSDYSLQTRGWPFSASHSPTIPSNATQFGVTSMPGGPAGRAGTLGGNGLAISQKSAHPREALELIRFLLRRDIQLLRARERAEPTEEVELYELPTILDPYPQLAKLRQHGGGVVAVSYTHLDVYKRQGKTIAVNSNQPPGRELY